jgi:hypothetical protein
MTIVEAFRHRDNRIGDGKKHLQPIKSIPLPEAKIIMWVKACQERYNKRAKIIQAFSAYGEMAGNAPNGFAHYSAHQNQNMLDDTFSIQRILEDMKLLQYQLVIYSQYMSYATGKQTVEG